MLKVLNNSRETERYESTKQEIPIRTWVLKVLETMGSSVDLVLDKSFMNCLLHRISGMSGKI